MSSLSYALNNDISFSFLGLFFSIYYYNIHNKTKQLLIDYLLLLLIDYLLLLIDYL